MNLNDYRDEIADVLIAHQRIPLFDDRGGQRCVGCDNLHGETDGPNSPRHAHHLTDALLASPALARLLAAARADGWDEGAAHASPHGGGYLRSLYAENPHRGGTR